MSKIVARDTPRERNYSVDIKPYPNRNKMSHPARDDYIRVKRRNQTFFIHTSPSDTFAQVKYEIALAMGGADTIAPQHMRLYIATLTPPTASEKSENDTMTDNFLPKGPVPDTATLSEYDVKNDAVLYLTFPKAWKSGMDLSDPIGDDSWEEINVFKP